MRLFSVLSILRFSGLPSPRRQARLLRKTQGSLAEARREALAQLRFAEDYGAPGDEAYWLEVLEVLAEREGNS
jgi:hypothetical protein